MSAHDEERGWRKRLTSGAPLAVLLAAGVILAYRLMPVLELVAIAMLLALVIRTAMNRLRGPGLGLWMSTLVLLMALGAFGAFLWLIIVPNVLQEARVLVSSIPGYVDDLGKLSERLHDETSLAPDLSGLSNRLKSVLERTLNTLPMLVAGVGYAVVDMVITLIMAVFMAHDSGSLIEGSLRFVPPRRRADTRRILALLEQRLRGWMVGTGVAMIILATGAGLGLWLLGVPLPITFALLAGLLNVVPYVGSIVGSLLPALVALTISPLKALLVVVLFVILHNVDGYVVQPMIMSHEVRLHPVVVIVAFLVFGRLLGFAGLFLAVPAAVVLATLVDEFLPQEPSSEEQKKKPGAHDAMHA